MPSSLWPDSATRKMYGQAGLKEQIKKQKETFSRELRKKDFMNQKEVELLRNKVKAYESLKWYKKLWLAILELFGKKREIID